MAPQIILHTQNLVEHLKYEYTKTQFKAALKLRNMQYIDQNIHEIEGFQNCSSSNFTLSKLN